MRTPTCIADIVFGSCVYIKFNNFISLDNTGYSTNTWWIIVHVYYGCVVLCQFPNIMANVIRFGTDYRNIVTKHLKLYAKSKTSVILT